LLLLRANKKLIPTEPLECSSPYKVIFPQIRLSDHVSFLHRYTDSRDAFHPSV
jgi:hypothetical protein